MKKFVKSLGMLLGRRPAMMQVAALCIDPANGKVMLITSRGTGRWIIPKGWPMKGKTLPGAAAREAWEEAGVEGQVDHQEIGRFSYEKEQDSGYSVPVEVRVFAIEVSALATTFPEMNQRERHWFDPAEAAQLVREPGLKSIICQLSARPMGSGINDFLSGGPDPVGSPAT